MEYNCPSCKKIIVLNIEDYLEKYPEEKWMHCPYCGIFISIKDIKDSLNEK